VCAATNIDSYYAVSIAHLCTVSGLLVTSVLRPLHDTSNVIVLVLLCVAELAALGMTFASSQGSTALFLHFRGVYALLIPVALEHLQCNPFGFDFLRSQDVSLALALALISTQLAPFDTLSCVLGGVACGGIGMLLLLLNRSAGFYVAVGVAGVLLLSSVGLWIAVWFPNLPKLLMPDLSIPVFTSFGLPVIKLGSISVEAGPWLLTFVLGLFWIVAAYVGVSQAVEGNLMFASVIGLPAIMILVWVLLLWLFRESPPEVSEEASAPPISTTRRLAWPRVRVVPKEHVP